MFGEFFRASRALLVSTAIVLFLAGAANLWFWLATPLSEARSIAMLACATIDYFVLDPLLQSYIDLIKINSTWTFSRLDQPARRIRFAGYALMLAMLILAVDAPWSTFSLQSASALLPFLPLSLQILALILVAYPVLEVSREERLSRNTPESLEEVP